MSLTADDFKKLRKLAEDQLAVYPQSTLPRMALEMADEAEAAVLAPPPPPEPDPREELALALLDSHAMLTGMVIAWCRANLAPEEWADMEAISRAARGEIRRFSAHPLVAAAAMAAIDDMDWGMIARKLRD